MRGRYTASFLIIAIFVLLVMPFQVMAFKELTDRQMDAVTAGSQGAAVPSQEALTRIPFNFTSGKGKVNGEAVVMPMNVFNQTGGLQLMDNAQSNLHSLININAVNSPVQVLLNLNVNINSRIGNLNQANQLLFGR